MAVRNKRKRTVVDISDERILLALRRIYIDREDKLVVAKDTIDAFSDANPFIMKPSLLRKRVENWRKRINDRVDRDEAFRVHVRSMGFEVVECNDE